MNSKKVLLVTCLLGMLLSIICYFYSPEKVAIHFNAKGIADSWASKNINLILWIAVYSIMTGFFLSIPLILKKTPIKFINMPNKQYWLAPERIDHTVTIVSNMLYRIGAALNIFFIVLGFIGFRANLFEEVRLDNTVVYILLGIFSIFTIGWLIKFYSQFKKPV